MKTNIEIANDLMDALNDTCSRAGGSEAILAMSLSRLKRAVLSARDDLLAKATMPNELIDATEECPSNNGDEKTDPERVNFENWMNMAGLKLDEPQDASEEPKNEKPIAVDSEVPSTDEFENPLDGKKPYMEYLSSKYHEKWYRVSDSWYCQKCMQKSLKKAHEKYADCSTRFHGSLYHVVKDSSTEMEDHFVAVVHGGNNGSGLWRNYIDEISGFIHELERYFRYVWVVSLDNDCCDDVYTLVLGLKR